MSDFKRIPILVDAATGKQIDEFGSVVRDNDYFRLLFDETVILCCQFYDVNWIDGVAELNPHRLNPTLTFAALGDSDFDPATPYMFLSEQSQDESNTVNLIGDWFNDETATPLDGQLSFRVDTNTERFTQALQSSSGRQSFYFCVTAVPSGQTATTVLAYFKFKAENRPTASTGSPASADPEYLNTQEVQALVKSAPVREFSIDGVNLWHSTQTPEDLYYREQRNGGEWSEAVAMAVGPQGEQGIAGTDGINGISAYQVWLNQGNSGTEADFIASLKGAQGVQGEQGPAGIDGTDGANGSDGASAYQTWLDQGNSGTEADFLTALKGADGTGLNNRGSYSVATTYAINDLITYQGSMFISKTDNNTSNDPATSSANWLLAVSKGDPGTDGTDGTDGANGTDGASAYQTWLDQGNSGTEADFIATLKGDTGATGSVDSANGLTLEEVSEPVTPSSGVVIYSDSADSGKAKVKDSSGTVKILGEGSGGGSTTPVTLSTSGNVTIDGSLGDKFTLSPTGAVTLSLNNLPELQDTFLVVKDGNNNITLPDDLIWKTVIPIFKEYGVTVLRFFQISYGAENKVFAWHEGTYTPLSLISDGLVARFILEDNVGANETIADSVAGTYNTTANSGLPFVLDQDRFGRFVVDADGAADAVFPGSGLPATSFSLSAMIKTTSDGICFGYGIDSSYKCALLQITGGNFALQRGSGDLDSGVKVNDGLWHNIIATYDSPTQTTKLYVDGVLEYTTSSYTFDLSSASNTGIIGDFLNRSATPYTGKLSDCRIYNRALTLEEAQKISNDEG